MAIVFGAGGLRYRFWQGGGRGHLRASHADRERVIGTLTAAYVYGLVTKEEFDGRVSQTFAARTYGELAVITADIPAGLAPAPPPLRPAPAPANPAADASQGAGDRAFVAMSGLAGVLVVAAFFAGHVIVLPLLLAAFGSAFMSLCARRDARLGGQLPPQKEVHSGPEAARLVAAPAPAEQLRYASKSRRPGNAGTPATAGISSFTVKVTDATGLTATEATSITIAGGRPAITAPASTALPSAAPGGATSAQLGTVTVTDNRGIASASWTATVNRHHARDRHRRRSR